MADSKTKTAAPKPRSGPTDGVMAPGKVGRAARQVAAAQDPGTGLPAWDRPRAKYADSDDSIDARMWRLKRDHRDMGVRS